MVNVKVVNYCYFVADLDLDGAKTYNTYICSISNLILLTSFFNKTNQKK